MHRQLLMQVLTTGFAVFSMFFGAGNLIFSVNLGRMFQSQTPLALVGFLLTGVCLPLLGIVSITLFGGDCRAWFARAGRRTGAILYVTILLLIGPLVPMPRIVALAYTMLVEYLPNHTTQPLFALLFLTVTLLCAITQKRVIELLGKWISPLLLICLALLVAAALTIPAVVHPSHLPAAVVLHRNLIYGYNTTDFITSIYFGAIIIAILRKNTPAQAPNSQVHRLCLLGSSLGLLLQGLVYVGLAIVGARLTNPHNALNEGQVLAVVSRHALGHWGGLLMGMIVTLACLSTLIALAVLLADQLTNHAFGGKVKYRTCLLATLIITGLIANLGLSSIIKLSEPLLRFVHPAIIALAIVNILHKTVGFRPARSIVWICLVASVWLQRESLMEFCQSIYELFAL
ncbi:MAG: branched-chain amino acid transport system II carrier protein [Myxococcota bacterium]